MVDDPKEIVLDLLRAIRADQADMKDVLHKHDKHFVSIQRQIAGVRGDLAALHEVVVDYRDDFEGLKRRVERIERRLELADTQTDS